MEKAHNADLHCVDWNPHDENLILTGLDGLFFWPVTGFLRAEVINLSLLKHFYLLSYSRSADNSVRMFDRRNLTSSGVGSPVYKFEGHKAAVLCVQVWGSIILYSPFY